MRRPRETVSLATSSFSDLEQEDESSLGTIDLSLQTSRGASETGKRHAEKQARGAPLGEGYRHIEGRSSSFRPVV